MPTSRRPVKSSSSDRPSQRPRTDRSPSTSMAAARRAAAIDRGWWLPDDADVAGLGALLSLRDVELALLILVEVPVPCARDRAEVHEDVWAPVVRGDEAEALLAVEPLHGSCSHVLFLLPCPDEPDRCSGAFGPWTERELHMGLRS